MRGAPAWGRGLQSAGVGEAAVARGNRCVALLFRVLMPPGRAAPRRGRVERVAREGPAWWLRGAPAGIRLVSGRYPVGIRWVSSARPVLPRGTRAACAASQWHPFRCLPASIPHLPGGPVHHWRDAPGRAPERQSRAFHPALPESTFSRLATRNCANIARDLSLIKVEPWTARPCPTRHEARWGRLAEASARARTRTFRRNVPAWLWRGRELDAARVHGPPLVG